MGFSLFPKTVKFYDLFKEQNKKIRKAAAALNDLFHDFQDIEQKCQQINLIESDGNKVSRNIATQLSQTFITPIDREDIHEINLTQEAILNLIKAISTRIGLYEIGRIRYPAQRLAHNLHAMVEETGVMLDRLHERKPFEQSVEKVKALKYECEMILLVALGENYDCEELNVQTILGIVKWSHVYDRIEEVVEKVEALADIFEGIMLKNA